MGLRDQGGLVDILLSRVMQMEESVTYQAIIERGMERDILEGRASEAFNIIVRQGRKKFGKEPTPKQRTALVAITDLEQLQALGEKLLDVSNWSELLKPE